MLKKQIAIVDDDEGILDFLFDALDQSKYEVVTFNNAGKAYEHILDNFIDVLITDIRMEFHNGGKELIENINELPPNDRPVVFVISGETDLSFEDAKRLGVHRYYLKPFSLTEFMHDLEEALA